MTAYITVVPRGLDGEALYAAIHPCRQDIQPIKAEPIQSSEMWGSSQEGTAAFVRPCSTSPQIRDSREQEERSKKLFQPAISRKPTQKFSLIHRQHKSALHLWHQRSYPHLFQREDRVPGVLSKQAFLLYPANPRQALIRDSKQRSFLSAISTGHMGAGKCCRHLGLVTSAPAQPSSRDCLASCCLPLLLHSLTIPPPCAPVLHRPQSHLSHAIRGPVWRKETLPNAESSEF